MDSAPVIEVRKDGAGFVVAVVPDDPARPVQRFSDKRQAFGAAH